MAWPTVCRPTTWGGLRVLDLKLAGFALRARWLWLQKMDSERAWSKLQIKIKTEVHTFFKAFVTVRGGLLVQAIIEYIDLWHRLSKMQLIKEQEDTYQWQWTVDGNYTVASAYQKMQEGSTTLQCSNRIWRNWAPLRVKFFTWLATKGRLWTADRR